MRAFRLSDASRESDSSGGQTSEVGNLSTRRLIRSSLESAGIIAETEPSGPTEVNNVFVTANGFRSEGSGVWSLKYEQVAGVVNYIGGLGFVLYLQYKKMEP